MTEAHDEPTTVAPESGDDAVRVPEVDDTPRALRHLGIVGLTLLAVVGLTYVVPPMHRFRPWAPGDPLPYSTMFRGEPTASVAATGGAGRQDVDQRALEREVGREVAANLPSTTRETHRGAGIAPAEYAGIAHRIEDPTGRGMRPFYDALARTARRERGAMTRVAHYGDSSIATDLITYTLRRRLQQRFGDGGHGFVLLSKGYLPYRHRDVLHSASENWRVSEVTRRMSEDGFYGYGGISARGGAGARARFAPDPDAPVGRTVSRFSLLYQRRPSGGDVELVVDEGTPRVLHTAADAVTDAVEHIDVPDGDHTLEVRALGTVLLYGMVLERPGPGIVYDSLGLVGARAQRLVNFDPAHIEAQIRARDVDLLVLGFGGNEASDSIDPEVYARDFEEVIRRMRSGREDLGCLVVAPLDQADGNGRTFRGVPTIVATQREVAHRMGCAFFDTWNAMGGSGAMTRWRRTTPRLAMGDGRHAAPEGYEVISNMMYKALLEGFASYLRLHGGR